MRGSWMAMLMATVLVGCCFGSSAPAPAAAPRPPASGAYGPTLPEPPPARVPTPPAIEPAAPLIEEGSGRVQGSLSREVIQSVIRSHLGEVRHCYERELLRDPTLAGRVAVTLVVGGTGSVTTAAVDESTLGSPSAETCIVTAVRAWVFPAPEGGGEVTVRYPFVFSST